MSTTIFRKSDGWRPRALTVWRKERGLGEAAQQQKPHGALPRPGHIP